MSEKQDYTKPTVAILAVVFVIGAVMVVKAARQAHDIESPAVQVIKNPPTN